MADPYTSIQSGYKGWIKWNCASGFTVPSPASAAGVGLTKLGQVGTLQSWKLYQTQGIFEAYAKQDAWVQQFPTVKRWHAEIQTTVPTDVSSADMQVGFTIVQAVFVISDDAAAQPSTVPHDYLYGDGTITELSIDSPLDGPVIATMKLVGTKIAGVGANVTA